MPSSKKLTVYRKSQFSGPRRGKPPVRKLNQAIRERIDNEKQMLEQLVRDADIRRALLPPLVATEPFVVWNDFDQASSTITGVNIHQLPKWEHIGEYLKLHLFFQVALEDGGYSFTARVRPDLEAKWKVESRDPIDRIRRLMDRAVTTAGLRNLEYTYVVESRSRRGTGRTPLHLHGFLLAQDSIVATRFKVAVEGAIVNCTSVVSYKGSKELLDYASTKGAITAFTRSLSANLVEKGIRVNAVAPGPIWTPLNPMGGATAEKMEEFGKNTPMQRPGQPWEVAPSFLFLACEDSSYMTGQVLHPNGGTIVNG